MRAMTLKNAAIQACDEQRYADSARLGSESLTQESAWVRAQAAIHRRVLSFSLFGDNPIYCETAILNAQAMPNIYPDWQMWLYHDTSVPEHVLARLRQHGVRLMDVTKLGISHWPGTFWRFHAVSEPHIEKVQFRDADSLISSREAQWVRLWLDSPQPFHVFRDWYSHLDLMLAGMWGAHAPLLAQLPQWIESHLKTQTQLHPTHADQVFLAHVVWPRIAPYSLVHDTVHDLPFATPIDSPRPAMSGGSSLGGFNAKQITVTLSAPATEYRVTIYDTRGDVIMSYLRHTKNGKDVFELPMQYHERIRTGEWRIEYLPITPA